MFSNHFTFVSVAGFALLLQNQDTPGSADSSVISRQNQNEAKCEFIMWK